ncbi:MAG TPA: 1-acyl-sn-glycerol-3-phosphate acyltransferase, partial [Nevskiaceae bacterium]|nr:1-acyl-sn-glycerol-3-phosphate acyltransferase [Nevskiaceae bacterium]
MTAAPAWGSAFTRWLGRTLLRVGGWTVDLHLPSEPKLVLACAPHTSNWDGLWLIATIFSVGVRVNWFGKDTLFHWPFRGLLVWLGGVPIRRDRAADVVATTAEIFASRERMWVGIAPEGTRGRAPIWKSGFHR